MTAPTVHEIFRMRKEWDKFLKERGISEDDRNTLWNMTLKIFEE